MSSYEALAASYDRLTDDVSYQAVFDYLESLLKKVGKKPESVLDLACGTGSLSVLLVQQGYRVLGADLSEDMLAVAYEKSMEMEGENRPYFIHQSMQKAQADNIALVVAAGTLVVFPAALQIGSVFGEPGQMGKKLR